MGLSRWKRPLLGLLTAVMFWATPMAAARVEAAPIAYSENPDVSAKVEAAYGALPEALRKSFEADGWNIMILNSTAMDQTYGNGQMASKGYVIEGVTVYKQKVVALNAGKDYALDAMYHELGHYFDYTMGGKVGFLSEKPDFMTIYQVEAKNSGMGQYITSNVLEYYAQAFKLVLENPVLLQEKAPQTYLYVTTALENYKAAN